MIVKSRRAALDAQIAQYIEQSKAFRSAGQVTAALDYAQRALALRRQLNALPASPAEPVVDHSAAPAEHLVTTQSHQASLLSDEAYPAPARPSDVHDAKTMEDNTQHPLEAAIPPTIAAITPQFLPDNRTRKSMDHAYNPQLHPDGVRFDDAPAWDHKTATAQSASLMPADGAGEAFDALLWPEDLVPEGAGPELPDYDPAGEFNADDFEAALLPPARLKTEKVSKVPRHKRALEVAARLGNRYGWDAAGIEIMAQVFTRYFWSSAQHAMVRELEAGLTPEELRVALQARVVWDACGQFHVSLYGYEYPALGWRLAVVLARELDADAGEDEIFDFLTDAHEVWRDSPGLMREYPDFHRYLAYSLCLDGDAIKAPPGWSFVPARTEDY